MDTEYKQLPDVNTSPGPSMPSSEDIKRQRRTIIIAAIVLIILLVILLASLAFLLSPDTSSITVARIRDVFIIIMAIESLFVGLVLTILMVQLARLINLLQNEVQPILDSTNETISNLRGTTEFLSSNVAEPIIKLNEYLAGFQKMTEILGIKRKK